MIHDFFPFETAFITIPIPTKQTKRNQELTTETKKKISVLLLSEPNRTKANQPNIIVWFREKKNKRRKNADIFYWE